MAVLAGQEIVDQGYVGNAFVGLAEPRRPGSLQEQYKDSCPTGRSEQSKANS
jgi:hypothetical protein